MCCNYGHNRVRGPLSRWMAAPFPFRGYRDALLRYIFSGAGLERVTPRAGPFFFRGSAANRSEGTRNGGQWSIWLGRTVGVAHRSVTSSGSLIIPTGVQSQRQAWSSARRCPPGTQRLATASHSTSNSAHRPMSGSGAGSWVRTLHTSIATSRMTISAAVSLMMPPFVLAETDPGQPMRAALQREGACHPQGRSEAKERGPPRLTGGRVPLVRYPL